MFRLYIVIMIITLGYCSSALSERPVVLDSDFEIVWLNEFECPYASSILGLEYWESGGYLEFVDGYGSTTRGVYECNPDNGAVHTFTECDYLPGSYEWPWGVMTLPNMIVVNDTGDDRLWEYSYGTWDWGTNPATHCGKGLDYDGIYFWETRIYDVMRWLPANPEAAITISSPSTTGMLAGLTVFTTYYGGTGIAVCEHDAPYTMAFYGTSGSSLTHIYSLTWSGVSGSRGLAYSESRGTFFWSYVSTGGTPFIGEFWCPDATALDQNTWARIKSEFQ